MTLDRFFSHGFLLNYIEQHSAELTDNTIIAMWAIGLIGSLVIAYLLGSINFAIIISSKTYKDDIRDHGSKNAGMTNMMRTYGKKAAALTLLGDALKAVVACLIGYALLGQLGAYIAGTGCVFGHVFPIFFKFKGGKGVVTTAATILMCDPFIFLIIVLLFVGIVAISKYISLGSVMCALIYPFILAQFGEALSPIIVSETGDMLQASPYVIFALLISVLVIFKHKDNIKRLREGTESKFKFKKSVNAPKDDKSN